MASAGETSPFQAQVNADDINIRCDSTISSEVISRLNKGELVEVVLELYDWYKIKLPLDAPAFIKKDMVVALDEKTVKVLKDRTNIRLHPNTASAIIGVVKKDTRIDILEDKGDWYKIKPVANSFGWINKKFVHKIPAIDTIKENKKDINENMVSVEGMVKARKLIFKPKWPYMLIADNRGIFFLKANKEKLSSLNNCKVKIIGKLINSEKQKFPLIEVVNLERLE